MTLKSSKQGISLGKRWRDYFLINKHHIMTLPRKQLYGRSHGRRSLIGYSPWGRKESDTTEQLHFTSLQNTLTLISDEDLHHWIYSLFSIIFSIVSIFSDNLKLVLLFLYIFLITHFITWVLILSIKVSLYFNIVISLFHSKFKILSTLFYLKAPW